MEITKLTDYIVLIDNMLIQEKSDQFENVIESNLFNFQKAKISIRQSNIVDETIRKTETCGLSNYYGTCTSIHWCNFMLTNLNRAANNYCSITNTNIRSNLKEMQLLKYEKNGFYKTHIDHAAATPRTLSMVYFINDNYEDGNLFFNLPKNEEFKIEKKKNRCVIWPSNFLYPHRVEPVKTGTKYSLVAWTL